jgi:hypothetical protein
VREHEADLGIRAERTPQAGTAVRGPVHSAVESI